MRENSMAYIVKNSNDGFLDTVPLSTLITCQTILIPCITKGKSLHYKPEISHKYFKNRNKLLSYITST